MGDVVHIFCTWDDDLRQALVDAQSEIIQVVDAMRLPENLGEPLHIVISREPIAGAKVKVDVEIASTCANVHGELAAQLSGVLPPVPTRLVTTITNTTVFTPRTVPEI